MNPKTTFKAILFSACFIAVWLLVIHEFIVGSLSPRGVGIAGGFLIGVSYLVFVLGIVKRTAQSLKETPAVPLDPATREQRMVTIRAWKLVIALLVLGLVTGLGKMARELPVWETMVLVAINLGLTGSIVWVVVRLRRSLD